MALAQRRHGMGIVEVAVTAVVIAAMAMLVVPVIARARNNARRQTCAVTMKRLGDAMALYMLDHGGYWPVTRFPRQYFCCWHHWLYVEELRPYLQDSPRLICPGDPSRGDPSTTNTIAGRTPEASGIIIPLAGVWTSYSLVRCLSVDESAVNQGQTWPIKAHRPAPYPERKILAMEHNTFHWGQPLEHDATTNSRQARYNALFCDGHVKYVSYGQIHRSAKQDVPGFEVHDPNYTVGGMSGWDTD